MGSPASTQVIFVVGMHRSGTSALCASLRACGVSFAPDLLRPMAGVNAEGFWEAAELVAINEELLRRTGVTWYSLALRDMTPDWESPDFADLMQEAREHLRRGLQPGVSLGVKDPRLCVTFPFWRALCERENIAFSTCSTLRDPMAIATSLQHRDGFPVGYGLRLLAANLHQMCTNLPADVVYVAYDALLENPRVALHPILQRCSLQADEALLEVALNSTLRHQSSAVQSAGEYWDLAAGWKLDALHKMIEDQYPLADTVEALVVKFVERGRELTRIGDEHSVALGTLDCRDRDVARLGEELRDLHEAHSQALAIIEERSHWYYPFKAVLAKLMGWFGMKTEKTDNL